VRFRISRPVGGHDPQQLDGTERPGSIVDGALANPSGQRGNVAWRQGAFAKWHLGNTGAIAPHSLYQVAVRWLPKLDQRAVVATDGGMRSHKGRVLPRDVTDLARALPEDGRDVVGKGDRRRACDAQRIATTSATLRGRTAVLAQHAYIRQGKGACIGRRMCRAGTSAAASSATQTHGKKQLEIPSSSLAHTLTLLYADTMTTPTAVAWRRDPRQVGAGQGSSAGLPLRPWSGYCAHRN